MLNPFYIYIAATFFVWAIFSLKWSNSFQDLSSEYFYTIILILFFNLFVGIILGKYLRFKKYIGQPVNIKLLVLAFSLCYTLDIIYSGSIPIVSAINNSTVYYKDINHIPSFYPLLIALNVFYSIKLMYIFVSLEEKKYLYGSLFLLIFFILMMGRGILIMTIISLLIIYISSLKISKISKKIKEIIFYIAIVVAAFGILGNLRPVTNENYNEFNHSDLILELGNATTKFESSYIPTILFPFYLYTVSPSANLSNTLKNATSNEYNLKEFFIYNFTSQSMQKNLYFRVKKDKSFLVEDAFNVSTIWALPFMQLGFIGIILAQFLLFIIFMITLFITYKSNYFVIFLSLFSNIMILSNFTNILVLDNIMLPIILCIIFSFFDRIKI